MNDRLTQEQFGTDAALLGAGTQSLSQIGRRYNTGYDGRVHMNGNNKSIGRSRDASARKRYSINVVQDSHGTVTAVNYGRSEAITEKEPGRYVEVRVAPEEGYFLKDLRILAVGGIQVRRYDGADSFGFDMPKGDVTLIPEFEKRSLAGDVPPSDRMYREVRDYKDGKYTGMALYIPVEIRGIPETCAYGESPVFSVRTAGGTELTEGEGYTLAQATEKTDEGIRHIMIFEGKGGPVRDGDGYFTGSNEVYKGKQVITYTERYKSAYAKLPEIVTGETISVQFDKSYCFTPEADGEYCFTFDKPDPLYLKVSIKSDKAGEEPQEGRVSNGTFIAKLSRGVTYSVSTRASYNTNDLKALDLVVEHHISHSIAVARPLNGMLAVVSNGVSVSEAYRGETVDIRVAPMEGCYLKNLSVTTLRGESVGLVDCFYTYLFKMPDEDVIVAAEFNDISLTSKTPPEDTLYRETEVYSNGRRTEGVAYVPVEISGIIDTCTYYGMPDYKLVSADGTVLEEGVDYTLIHETEDIDGGVLHRMSFEGTGAVYKGERSIRFLEVPSERLSAGSNSITAHKRYIFIPEEDGKYQMTFTDDPEVRSSTRISWDYGEVGMDVSGPASLTFDLLRGKCYEFSFASADTEDVFEIQLEKLMRYQLTVQCRGEGRVEPDSFSNENVSDGMIVSGDIVALWIHPDEGRALMGITALDSDNRTVELIDTAGGRVYHFKMPESDITVFAEFCRIQPEVIEPEEVPEADVREEPAETKTVEVPVIRNARDNYCVTYSEVSDMGYSNYVTGNNVFKLDFRFVNLKNARYRGALLQFEFDAPIGKFMYGADLGNSIVIISTDDPKKVIVNFSTYDNEGEDAPERSSYLVLSPAEDVMDLRCVNARVISVTE